MSETIYICEKFNHFAIERGLNLLQYIKITMLTLLAKEKRKMKISGASYFFENYAKKLDIISRSGSRPQFLESKVLHYDEDRKNKLNTSWLTFCPVGEVNVLSRLQGCIHIEPCFPNEQDFLGHDWSCIIIIKRYTADLSWHVFEYVNIYWKRLLYTEFSWKDENGKKGT